MLVLVRRFLIGRTANTLLMGDLESCKLSEIPWQTDGSEKFHFENDRVCMVHYQVRPRARPPSAAWHGHTLVAHRHRQALKAISGTAMHAGCCFNSSAAGNAWCIIRRVGRMRSPGIHHGMACMVPGARCAMRAVVAAPTG